MTFSRFGALTRRGAWGTNLHIVRSDGFLRRFGFGDLAAQYF